MKDKKVPELKILIVEDDADQRLLIRETLEDHFGADTVEEADSAAAALKLGLSTYKMILTDYNLPGCSGMDLLVEIKKRCDTPVIMVTGENVSRIATEAIKKGATDYVVKVGDYLFTIPLMVEKNLAIAKIKRENEQLRVELERLLKREKELAATDPLTGLYNRRHFSLVREQLYSESERLDSDLSCVMIDLDTFKQLNDTLGHGLGDQLLSLAGRIIAACMRKMDVAARYGGDEFILLLPHTSADDALSVAQRIGDEFRRGSALVLRRNEGVTMSLGIASRLRNAPSGADQLVALADEALYRAKASGRNRALTHEPAVPS